MEKCRSGEGAVFVKANVPALFGGQPGDSVQIQVEAAFDQVAIGSRLGEAECRHATIEGDLSLEDLKLDVAIPSEEAC